MPKINSKDVEENIGSGYPPPYDEPCQQRQIQRVSNAGRLTQFGVHIITILPGTWSSQRHWHSHEDEFVYILSGHPTLVDNAGRARLSPGDMTAHPGGEDNGHHMINETVEDVIYMVVGTRDPEKDSGHYPDIDLAIPANGTPDRVFVRKDGSEFKP